MITPNINSIALIYSSDNIAQSLSAINNNYSTLHLWVSAFDQQYQQIWQPVIDYYNNYSESLQNSLTLAQSFSSNWNDFQTTVESNSAKWLQPFTIFYPTLIQDTVTDNDVLLVKAWLDKYFPIRNNDGSLNYVEDQRIIVNCYTYSYDNDNSIDIFDEPYSYARCRTSSGTIYAHCQTIITGGTINCNQASYYCNTTYNTYPSKRVNCWYSSPYLYDIAPYGSPIINNVYDINKTTARGQIQAKITMKFLDRKENTIQPLSFKVYDCEWNYTGGL
jgi:hypothetical protein